ncbi:MAG: hypothetical protein WKF88_04845 [Ferruginibacter sp.]
MNLKTIATLALLTVASYASTAQAVSARPVSTLSNDNKRIHQGVKSGEITAAERARLKAQEAKIRQERKAYRGDGISKTERKDLRKDKKRLSKNIYRQKHDGQVRP